MNKDLQYYVQTYLKLSSQLCRTSADYTKEKVKKNNIAMKKLYKLQEELYRDIQLTSAVYEVLLDNEDIFIRQCVATECLRLKILEKNQFKF